MRALTEKADVFIHSMRSKAIAKLGFSYEQVAAINPTIVYTNCYGYGRRGPDKDLTAYDDTIQAECGLPAVQQMLTGEANYVGTIMADKVAGLTAVYATMATFVNSVRIFGITSKPLMRGIRRSRMTASGGSARHRSSAACPSAASAVTVWPCASS